MISLVLFFRKPGVTAGWLPASQQCFSLTSFQRQPPTTSQPAVFFSHNKSAPATSQPNEAEISNLLEMLLPNPTHTKLTLFLNPPIPRLYCYNPI
jgi:hypothetical protein